MIKMDYQPKGFEWYLSAPLVVLNLWTAQIGGHIKKDSRGRTLAIDPTDVVILSYIMILERSTSDAVISKKIDNSYVWIDRKTLLSRLPILSVNQDTLTERLRKMEKINLLEVRVVNISGKNRLYVKMSALFHREEERLQTYLKEFYKDSKSEVQK